MENPIVYEKISGRQYNYTKNYTREEVCKTWTDKHQGDKIDLYVTLTLTEKDFTLVEYQDSTFFQNLWHKYTGSWEIKDNLIYLDFVSGGYYKSEHRYYIVESDGYLGQGSEMHTREMPKRVCMVLSERSKLESQNFNRELLYTNWRGKVQTDSANDANACLDLSSDSTFKLTGHNLGDEYEELDSTGSINGKFEVAGSKLYLESKTSYYKFTIEVYNPILINLTMFSKCKPGMVIFESLKNIYERCDLRIGEWNSIQDTERYSFLQKSESGDVSMDLILTEDRYTLTESAGFGYANTVEGSYEFVDGRTLIQNTPSIKQNPCRWDTKVFWIKEHENAIMSLQTIDCIEEKQNCVIDLYKFEFASYPRPTGEKKFAVNN